MIRRRARSRTGSAVGTAESSADPLRIEAVLDGNGRTAHREVAGGPGPSIVDLPEAGCWHLTLDWGPAPEMVDTMDLVSVDPGTRQG